MQFSSILSDKDLCRLDIERPTVGAALEGAGSSTYVDLVSLFNEIILAFFDISCVGSESLSLEGGTGIKLVSVTRDPQGFLVNFMGTNQSYSREEFLALLSNELGFVQKCLARSVSIGLLEPRELFETMLGGEYLNNFSDIWI
jgi:hypothetical protein